MITQELLSSIASKIELKRSIYVALIRSNLAHFNSSNEDKTHFAEDVFTSELEAFIERIKSYANENVNKPPTLTEFQGVNIFLEVMQMGLSFAPAAGLIYLSRLKGTGTAIGYQITVKGMVFLATKAGSISHVSEVVIVRNNEPFKIVNKENVLTVEHEMDFSASNFDYNDFKCGYVYITYPSGDKELKWTDKATMDKAFGLSMNKAMYNDTSFLKSKVMKRALKFENKTSFLMNSISIDEIEYSSSESI